jgi:hypothetical protein
VGGNTISGPKIQRPEWQVRQPRVRQAIMMLVPFITFWGVGFILDIQADYLVKLGRNVNPLTMVSYLPGCYFSHRLNLGLLADYRSGQVPVIEMFISVLKNEVVFLLVFSFVAIT